MKSCLIRRRCACVGIPYEVTFFTGDVAEAGTDSEIFIKVFGVKGSSADIVIPKMNERFERSRTDLIKVCDNCGLYDLIKVCDNCEL